MNTEYHVSLSLIARETMVTRYGTAGRHREPHRIIEVADIAVWHIEQRYEFSSAPRAIGVTDRYWYLNMVDELGDQVWTEAIEPHRDNPYVAHRVIDPSSALVRYTRSGTVEIYVAEMIPSEARVVALDACLQNDIASARKICECHAVTQSLAFLALDTIIIEANGSHGREQSATYQ